MQRLAGGRQRYNLSGAVKQFPAQAPFKPGDLHAQRRLPVEPLRDAGHITLLRKAKEILLNVHRAAPGNLA